MLMYGRNQHNNCKAIILQLIFFFKKKWCKSFLVIQRSWKIVHVDTNIYNLKYSVEIP